MLYEIWHLLYGYQCAAFPIDRAQKAYSLLVLGTVSFQCQDTCERNHLVFTSDWNVNLRRTLGNFEVVLIEFIGTTSMEVVTIQLNTKGNNRPHCCMLPLILAKRTLTNVVLPGSSALTADAQLSKMNRRLDGVDGA